MKVLKWFPIVLGILLGLILIVALILPKEITIHAERQIDVSRDTLFHKIALYEDREKWDPWLKTEPTAEVNITPKQGYVGSTYTWSGADIGTGTMEVISVQKPTQITGHIWFGEMPDPSTVTWEFENKDGGTYVTWSFTSKGKYPLGRFMLQLMKSPLSKSFNDGLDHLKMHMESTTA